MNPDQMPRNSARDLSQDAELVRSIAYAMDLRPFGWFDEFEYYDDVYQRWEKCRYDEDVFENLPSKVRPRPRTITIAGMEVPEPLREPLDHRKRYYVAIPTDEGLVFKTAWNGDRGDDIWLRRGLIHLTEDAARQHARALIRASGGEVDDE